MRMVSRTPQARSCCTTRLESYLTEGKAARTTAQRETLRKDERSERKPSAVHPLKRELLIVGLDAADVVRRGGVQRLHQQRERAGELGGAKNNKSVTALIQ